MAISKNQVLDTAAELPVFPRIINEILHTIDDPNFNFNALVKHVSHDPVLTGQVFSIANQAATHIHHDLQINDLYKATSLVGIMKLQKMVILASMSNHFESASSGDLPEMLWARSLATGLCAQHVAAFSGISDDAALIAGLLHNVGKLWLHRFLPQAYRSVLEQQERSSAHPCQIEREAFGVDHAMIGSWLAEFWSLPPQITDAILHYCDPDKVEGNPYVDAVHVAEVIGNALDLAPNSSVTYLSDGACNRLGLAWDERAEDLFGTIEASIRILERELLISHPTQFAR